MSPKGFKPTWIVIHHSSSRDGQTRNFDSIKQYHMSYRYNGEIISESQYAQFLSEGKTSGLEKPWSDIGYNFVIENDKGHLCVIGGRPIGEVGAHAIGFNAKSVGICLVGNYDIDTPDDDRLFSLASLCRQIQREFDIPKDQVVGHRETYVLRKVPIEKTCPGAKFDMDAFRKRLL